MKSRFVVLTVLAAATTQPMTACDLCSVYAASEAQGGGGQGFFGGVAEQFTYFNTLQIHNRKISNDGEYIDSYVSQVFAGYNLSDRLGVQLSVPILYRAYGSTSGGNKSESGIGDISLLANYRIYERLREDSTLTWTALGGIKLPTGDANHLNPNEPDFADGIGGHDLALGSGSVDGLIGSGMVARWKRIFLEASLQYAIRSPGAFDYQYDNDLSWTGGPGYYLALTHNYTFAVQAVCSGETKGQDRIAGERTDDTAETIVYFGPEFHFTWGTRLSAQAGVDLPLLINNGGEQLVPNFRIHAAITCRF